MVKIITISGLDGSGKSTQVKLLKNYLESRGKRVFYFHAVEFSLAKKLTDLFSLLFRKKYTSPRSRDSVSKNYLQNYPQKSVTKASWIQIQLRKIALRIDIWRFRLLSKKLLNNGYDYILSDRFFHDSVVNIEYLEQAASNKQPASPAGRQAFPILHTTYYILPIYLQTSPQNIMNRERVPDQGLEYLQKKKELYDAKTKIWNWKVIDGNRDKKEIFEEIKKTTNRISD